MKVFLQKRVADSFRRRSRRSYPKEEMGILLGDIQGDEVYIKGIYYPPEAEESSTKDSVDVCMDWFDDAQDKGKDKGLIPVGDIHSHCYELTRSTPTHEPSEADWDSTCEIHACVPTYCVHGICRVVYNRTLDQLYSSLRLWPLSPPMETTMVMGEEEEE